MTGFIEPEGLNAMGHYVAYVKRKTGFWEVHDDLSRRPKVINPENISITPPYIIFYQNIVKM